MKAIINGSTLTLDEMQLLNAGSIGYYEMELVTTEDWDDTTKKAIILKDGETVGNEIPVVENTVRIDRTVEGKYYIGFLGFRTTFFKTKDTEIDGNKTYYILDNGDYVVVTNPVVADINNYYESVVTYQISTNLAVLVFDKGAGNVETVDISDEVPQASVFEAYIAQIDEVIRGAGNVNVDAIRVDGGVNVMITNKYGQTKTVTIFDGQDGRDGSNGRDGVDGRDGSAGRDGVDGKDGVDGVSPTVEVLSNTDTEYTLKITYDGGIFITPNLKGQKGNKGDTGSPGKDGVDGSNGRDGSNGQDGFSPTIAVNTSTDTEFKLAITDKNGTTVTPNLKGQAGQDGQNGQNGTDGFSPTIAVHTNTDTIYTLDITDKNGTTTTPNLKGQDGSGGGNLEIDILYNGKANNTAILSGAIQELSHSIFDYDMIIVGFNCMVQNAGRSMEICDTIYPIQSLIEWCDTTGAGANGGHHIYNGNQGFNNVYRILWGFTDETHIRNIVSAHINTGTYGWVDEGICYVVGYKFH